MSKRVLVGLAILALVIMAASGGFFAGTAVGASRARQDLFQGRFGGQGGQAGQSSQFQRPARTPQPGQGGGARSGGGIMGTIKSVEGDTLVVTTSEGDTQVHATDTTFIEKYTAVGVGDLEVGERVVVSGSQNDDGSVTARSIQSLRGFQVPQSGEP
jgi:hypothetical protein